MIDELCLGIEVNIVKSPSTLIQPSSQCGTVSNMPNPSDVANINPMLENGNKEGLLSLYVSLHARRHKARSQMY